MITIVKVGGHNNIRISEIVGLSTDIKPLTEPNGSLFQEMDTKTIYRFDKENNSWVPQKNHEGGEGTITENNYNNLINKPIINIMHGREPIILKNLAQGLYSITGNYKYDYSTETFTFNSPTLLQVENQNVNEKIIHFEINKNQERYYKEIYYMSDGSFTEETHTFNNVVSSDLADLPTIGEVSKIYTTPKGLFIWDDGQYKKLGADPTWGGF